MIVQWTEAMQTLSAAVWCENSQGMTSKSDTMSNIFQLASADVSLYVLVTMAQ